MARSPAASQAEDEAMVAKPAFRGFRGIQLSPGLTSILALPAALVGISFATALVCAVVHWS